MNDIRRFLCVSPLWVLLACRLLVKPIQIINPKDAGALRKMYQLVLQSIRWSGRNRLECWLIARLVRWIEAELKAMSELEMFGVTVVSGQVNDLPLPGEEERPA